MSAIAPIELRFEFGENWKRFLNQLDEPQIDSAARALEALAGDLRGKSFLDIGSGSGIHSLAAVRLGASRVHSFDYDLESVACTAELKRRYQPEAQHWTIEPGSVLDPNYVEKLGLFDVVYSWGVLHHTGNMWTALEFAARPVAPRGLLAVAIYNDQGFWSRYWRVVKRASNRMPRPLQPLYAALLISPVELRELAKATLKLQPGQYLNRWMNSYSKRGMNRWRDIVDWVGGYPFEVAKPEEIFSHYRKLGFILEKLTTCGSSKACNEFVFRRSS
jgi:2-polyprenyl-3-methyl-5-hydroxy-6-metoxy-1,4-benzoquinol methylase